MSHLEPCHSPPVRLTSFVGRERELAEVAGLLNDARLVTLVGAPGVGKTRLAIHVADRLRDRFADPVAFVELAPLMEPAFVPHAVAASLGIHEQSDRPMTELLADRLATRSVLLVLDNCEHLVMACATLVEELLRCAPGLIVLATSREPLGVEGETTWRVPSLSIPDSNYCAQPGADTVADVTQFEAVRLFLDRARAAVPAFAPGGDDASALVTICRGLDGIPLAIELAAARVSALSLVEIAARLDSRLTLLRGGRRTAVPRQQTVCGAIDWSYDLLTDEERRLLRRLSVFAGGWTLDAAEAVCRSDADADDGPPVVDLLVSLVDKSLVQVDAEAGAERRYRLLEMIRQYGLEKLGEAGEQAAIRRRHLVWYAELARQSRGGMLGPDSTAWGERLVAELDNARAALTWSLEDPDPASVHLGMRVAWGFNPLWFQRDFLLEACHWLERLLAADHEPGRNPTPDSDYLAAPMERRTIPPEPQGNAPRLHPRVRALVDLTIMVQQLGRLGRSEEAGQEALALARRVGDRHGEANALSVLGNIARSRGEYDRAVGLLAESLPLFRQLGDPVWIAHALTHLGETVGHQGDLDQARLLLEEALGLARLMGGPWRIGYVLKNLGAVVGRQGDLERAVALLEESLIWFERVRATRGLAWSNWDLGHVRLARRVSLGRCVLRRECPALARGGGPAWYAEESGGVGGGDARGSTGCEAAPDDIRGAASRAGNVAAGGERRPGAAHPAAGCRARHYGSTSRPG